MIHERLKGELSGKAIYNGGRFTKNQPRLNFEMHLDFKKIDQGMWMTLLSGSPPPSDKVLAPLLVPAKSRSPLNHAAYSSESSSDISSSSEEEPTLKRPQGRKDKSSAKRESSSDSDSSSESDSSSTLISDSGDTECSSSDEIPLENSKKKKAKKDPKENGEKFVMYSDTSSDSDSMSSGEGEDSPQKVGKKKIILRLNMDQPISTSSVSKERAKMKRIIIPTRHRAIDKIVKLKSESKPEENAAVPEAPLDLSKEINANQIPENWSSCGKCSFFI